jgi:hypothetical protein
MACEIKKGIDWISMPFFCIMIVRTDAAAQKV